MPQSKSPLEHSKYEGDSSSRRERSMSMSSISKNSSSEGEHSPMLHKKIKTESSQRFSRDVEKSRKRSVKILYRHDDRKPKDSDYSGSDFADYRDSILDTEESVDPSICNFRSTMLQNGTLQKDHRINSGDDRLKRMEKIMAKIIQNQNSRTPSEQKWHYGTHEPDRDHSNSRLKNLERMIEKMVENKTETFTFTAPREPNGLEELISCNSNFTTSMWLNKINEECLERSFDEKTCIKFLESKMTGSVKSWYKTLGSNDLTWLELKMLITQTFPDNSEFASTLRLLVNRFKKPDETMMQYYFSKMYLIEACRVSGVFAVSCLIDGLTDPKIQREAKANNFLTPESLFSHFLCKLSKFEPNHKDEMDLSSLEVNHTNANEKGHLRQPNPPNSVMEQTNHPKVKPDSRCEPVNLPKSGKEHPNQPKVQHNLKLGQPNFAKPGLEHPNTPKSGIEHQNHPKVKPDPRWEPPNLPKSGKEHPNHPKVKPVLRWEPPNLPKSGMEHPNQPKAEHDFKWEPPNFHQSGMEHQNFLLSGMEHPNHHPNVEPDLKLYQASFPNYVMNAPKVPNYGMVPHNYNQEFLPNHQNFIGDCGMGQPHNPNFGMEPYYGVEQWRQDPNFNNYSYPFQEHNKVPSGYAGERPAVAIAKCLNCSMLGHCVADCRAPKRCSICKQNGHIAPFCIIGRPSTKKTNPKLPLKPKGPGKY